MRKLFFQFLKTTNAAISKRYLASRKFSKPYQLKMNGKIESERIRKLNDKGVNKDGMYVLCWVQASHRTQLNHALELAIARANRFQVPVLCCFGLTEKGYNPNANLRHYAFMLEGLMEFRGELEELGIPFLIAKCPSPPSLILETAKFASEVIVDKGYLRVQRAWYKEVSDSVNCSFTQVESNVVVPVSLVSNQEEPYARAIRPKLWQHARSYLREFELTRPTIQGNKMNFAGLFGSKFQFLNISSTAELEETIGGLDVDRTVSRLQTFIGGHSEAVKRLRSFVYQKLEKYDQLRNTPHIDSTSQLSPYLHFGQISPIELILAVENTPAPPKAKDKFIDELMIWREMSINAAWFNPDNYDKYQGMPEWARKSLDRHRSDKRQYLYGLKEFEEAKTHDKFWNAAQLEMVHGGKMDGYMRMYWAKKVLEWSSDSETAHEILVYLNDKYELDGRDPNDKSYSGIGWCFGKYDEPFTPDRAVMGTVRYMGENGLIRKYKDGIHRYVSNCYKLAGRTVP